MNTIFHFIIANKSHMRTERVDNNPYADNENWQADHWRCSFWRAVPGRPQFTTYFSMGLGHKGKEPMQKDVLDCLASDAAGYENASGFEDWARDYGYNADSRKAEKTYRMIERQSARLKKFLGDAAYQELLWNVERL